VLDACAMIAYLRGESGGSVVDEMLRSQSDECYAHTVNLIEVYYDFIRMHSEQTARKALLDLTTYGLIERKAMARAFALRVGRLKARSGISLADCFCIALAQDIGGQVVTSDHTEFDPLVALQIVPIRFIR